DKTIAVTVKKSYFESGDYVADKTNSSSNSRYIPVGQTIGVALCGDNGVYTKDQLSGFTWTSSDTSIATVTSSSEYGGYMGTITGKKAGYATITVTDGQGNKRYFYIRVYKDITAITGNSTTFKLGKGNEHHLEVGSGKDISFTPADATLTTTYDLEFKSSNTSVTTIDNNAWVKGVGVGTATVSAKPLHSANITSFQTVRTFQVYDHSLQIIHKSPDDVTQNPDFYNTYFHKPIPEGATLQMVYGDKINLAFMYTQEFVSTSTSRVTLTNQSDFTTAETSGIVNIEAKVGTTIYQQVTALKTGTTKVAFVLMGDDGFFARTVNIKVIPNRSLPTGSYVSIMASYTSNSSSAPRALAVGQSENLYIYNSSGTQLTGDAISWKSSDTSIASIDPTTGSTTKVKGLKAGNVTITATDSFGKTFSFYYKVYNAVTSMTGKGTLLMGTNSQYTMAYNQDYTVSPSNATFTAASYFNWRSSNTNYATVESGGVVSTKNCGVANISAQPQHQYALSTYTTVRSITVAWWEAKCVSSNCTSSSAMKVGSTATPTTVITIDKGKSICLQFEYRTDSSSPWTVLNSASYVASDYDSSILRNVTGLEVGSSGRALQIGGNNTGTTKITITYKTSNQFFSNTFNVKVI
ncbi:MAG: Ig-like domain-containing protein, partial [Bacteroidales bacterium]|nr:Ig-like domain-containing protein [Bacteroidales bacterium]